MQTALVLSENPVIDREAHLEALVSSAMDAIISVDAAQQIVLFNPAAELMFGCPAAEALGTALERFIPERFRDAHRRHINEFGKTGVTARSMGALGTLQGLRAGGEEFPIEVSISQIEVDGAKLYTAIVRDVSSRKRTAEMQTLYTQAERRRRDLEALYRADEYLHRHLRLDQVLQALVDVVVDILHADKASVQVWDEQRGRLVVRAYRGYSREMISLMSTYRPGDGIAGNVFLSGEPIAVEDARFAPPPADRIAQEEGIYSVLSVPLTIGEQVYGVFAMDYCHPRSFSPDDRRLFMALAQRAAMAIENARLYEQAEQVAVLEERQRLARELHDSVTQSLYSLVLLAEAGRRFTEEGDLAHVSRIAARLGETGQQALREMRLLVYQMRPLALQETGLVGALQQRLDAVEKRAGVHARLEVSGILPPPGPWEEALYRIAQEALNNALKHAAATETVVSVRATLVDEHATDVELKVVDNGRGFDSADGNNGGIGLASMRERAARLGATIDIYSAPGQGTSVTVRARLGETPDTIIQLAEEVP